MELPLNVSSNHGPIFLPEENSLANENALGLREGGGVYKLEQCVHINGVYLDLYEAISV